MKKLLVFSMAALLVAAFCVPASALENVFGGYWRTRGFINENFSGQKDDPSNISRVDTRSRIYYDAILNDNLKFVNKFEWNVVWGDEANGGGIGTDGTGIFRIKHSYADFKTGPVEHRLGLQGGVYSRGFVFDDDFAGYNGVYRAERWWLRGRWIKPFEGNTLRPLEDSNDFDFDMVGFDASFSLGEAGAIIPYVIYGWSEDLSEFSGVANDDKASLMWAGLDADFTLGSFGLWGTFGWSGGSIDGKDGVDVDRSGFLIAAGGNVPLGPASIHAEGFYATGDDDLLDDDVEAFVGAPGQSYYWSEIMGFGTFDSQVSAGSPGNKISNIWALNLGATIKPFDKLSITGDLWYASLVEDNQTGKSDLGTEVDLILTYELVEGLKLDLIGAYLFAGDATSDTADKNKEDPWEIGWRTSLSF